MEVWRISEKRWVSCDGGKLLYYLLRSRDQGMSFTELVRQLKKIDLYPIFVLT